MRDMLFFINKLNEQKILIIIIFVGEGYIHYFDWGPNSGTNWMVTRNFPNGNLRSIESFNVEPGYSNTTMCLSNALKSGFFQVFNGDTWVVDLTFNVVCLWKNWYTVFKENVFRLRSLLQLYTKYITFHRKHTDVINVS